MICLGFPLVQFRLNGCQSPLERRVARGGELRRGKALQGHAGAVDLTYLIQAQSLDGRAAELLDADQALGLQSLQGLAHLATAGAGLPHDVRLDQTLTGDQAAVANALAHPLRHIGFGHLRGDRRIGFGLV